MSLSKIFLLGAIDFGVQWVMWGISSLLRTERFYDLTGSSTFLLIALKAYFDYSGKNVRAKIQTSAVVIWAVRLGFYLFSRVLKDGHDRRFTKAKEDPSLFLVYWTIQGKTNKKLKNLTEASRNRCMDLGNIAAFLNDDYGKEPGKSYYPRIPGVDHVDCWLPH